MSSRFPKSDSVAATIVFIAVAGELVIREMYHRFSAEVPRLLIVVGIWIVLMAAVVIATRRGNGEAARMVGRISVFVGLAVWLYAVGTSAISSAMGTETGAALVLWAAYAALTAGAWFAVRAVEGRWALSRRVACVSTFLFVASQPIVAGMRAQSVLWPEHSATPPIAASSDNKNKKAITVFLLLDELNAKAAAPIVAALSNTVRAVRFKELTPIDDATVKVVPAMFAGVPFPNAKPCGFETICSGASVLDFSRIIASRPDIDVVGFYHPYCAIRGLRSCAHLAPTSPVMDGGRWWCAALRRSAWLLVDLEGSSADRECSRLTGAVWADMVAGVEQAIAAAPVWEKGGFLYAHIPLPHPPGIEAGGPLDQHYLANLKRATRLVERIVSDLAREPSTRFTIVIFSDHPLRAAAWCGSKQYRHNGCPLKPEFVDNKVPLIVAGEVPAAFDEIQNNREIFRLATH